MNIGNFLQLQRAFQRDRICGAAAEIEHVPRINQNMRNPFVFTQIVQDFRQTTGHFCQGVRQVTDLLRVQCATSPGRFQRDTGEHRKLCRKGLRGSNADFGTGECRQHRVTFTRDTGFRDIDHGHDVLPCRLAIA